MALSWGRRRKFLYTIVASVLALIIAVLLYGAFFNAAPTCFDGSMNGDEHGVDCGGSCALLCKQESRSAQVLWSRVFEAAPGTFTAAAYVQNPNPGAGAKKVPYSFQLFDDKNALVIERQGTIDIPPVQTVPVIDPNIRVANRTVAKALFAFGADTIVWQRVGGLPVLRIGNQYLAPDASQLSATVSNDSLEDSGKVTVAAVLFDEYGVARAASKSTLERIPRKSSQQVVFTWAGGVSGVVRAEITVLPSF